MFHFLLYVAKVSSSLNIREKRTILNRISNPCKVNLTHTLGALLSHSKATFGFSFRFVDRATLPDYRAPLLVLIVVVKFYDLMGTTPRPLIKLFIYT